MHYPEPRIVITNDDADTLCEELLEQPLVATDSEWYHYDKKRHPCNNGLTACWTFCYRDEAGDLQLIYMHNFGPMSEGNIYRLKPWWTSEDCYKILHNAPVDWHVLANHGIVGTHFRIDTMVLDYLFDENRENRHGLKDCAKDHLGHLRKEYRETFGTPRLKMNGEPYASGELVVEPMENIAQDENLFELLVEYASEDALDTWLLYEFYKDKLRAIPWRGNKNYWDYFWEVESVITEIIMRVERRGMPLDLEFLHETKDEAERYLEWLEAEIIRFVGVPINPGSTKQRAAFFHGPPREVKKGVKVLFTVPALDLPVQEVTPTGLPKVGAAEMKALKKLATQEEDEELADCIGMFLDYSATSTQLKTFFRGLAEKQINGCIHTRINQVGTTSGRFSSSGPNLQNITTGKKDRFGLRDCFCAPSGSCLIVADFAQLEYRLLAHFTQDPLLIQAFTDNMDLHSLTAYNVFPEIKDEVDERFGGPNKEALAWIKDEYEYKRAHGKLLNFEIIYGVGPGKLGEQLGISKDDAWEMIQGWFSGYAYVRPWMNRILREASERGHVRTLIGRLRRPVMWALNSKDRRVRGREERTIVNAVIQGSAADVCERAMISIEHDPELREMGVRLIMQVHDELVMTCPIGPHRQAQARVKQLMENPFKRPLRVPLPASVGLGPTWASSKV